MLNGIFKVLKLLGRQGLPFKAPDDQEKFEVLTKPLLNHRIFVEIILLILKFDAPFKEHLEKAIEDSKIGHGCD